MPPRLPDVAWRPVGSALALVAVVLTAASGGYGYHRDELYFRMLPPAWGYVDQPPFTPLVVRTVSALVDQPWAIRVPATLAAVLAVLLVALFARELGGGSLAQGLAAWGYGFGVFPLLAGHLTSTSSFDLLAWLAAALFAARAVLRTDPRWWVMGGLVVGLASFDKLLIALWVVSLAVGLALVGPRRLPWWWLLAGASIAVLLTVPALLYQATHDWPQLTMGRALTAKNGASNRAQLGPSLLVLLGPFLVPTWVAGVVALLRRPAWRPVRFLAVAFAVLLVLCFVAAGQVYYPLGGLAVVYAAGCVPVAEWAARSARRLVVVVAAVAVNGVLALPISLPVVPESVVASTPVPGLNSTVGDQVGWPAYVAQVALAYRSLPPGERASAVVVTSNYGEAGAVARYGPALGLPEPLSGQNELWFRADPPAATVVAVVVGRGASAVAGRNATCTVVGRLDNGVGVRNEEQGQPVSVCRDVRRPWSQVWDQFQHYD